MNRARRFLLLVVQKAVERDERFIWSDHERDVAADLECNRARCFDPTAGRWLSTDPMAHDAGDANVFRYA